MVLGAGIPQPSPQLPMPLKELRHRIQEELRVVVRPMVDSFHHEYRRASSA
jgi:hypothetical protein